MAPRAVLFDADGVVQQNPVGWLDDLRSFVADGRGRDFLEDLFNTESPAMSGQRDFRDVVGEVAGRWGLADRAEVLLENWQRIEVSTSTIDVVTQVRATGRSCYLATNQNSYRAEHMKHELGYDEVFDGAFYSCDLGVLKPSPVFFARVLERVGHPPDAVVFIDDKEEYVRAAEAAGMRAETWSIGQGTGALRQRLAAHGLPL